MPIYEYEGEGRRILLRRPVAQRNRPVRLHGCTWKRVQLPSRITVGTGASPETMSQKSWKGYRKLELDGKLTDRPGYLPAKKVKEALLAPEVD
jgi:hypothetical protein